jgi:3-deoxy-D-manno-octulosonic-acid transferase
VSFFSPSGMAVAEKYRSADIVTYLPLDTQKNARRFLSIVQPEMAIFIKYEFWYHHLSALAFRHVPLLLASAIFRKEQAFFQWYGGFYKKMLFLFRQIFVQDQASLEVLRLHHILHCTVSGDTRFDRVKKIAGQFSELPLVSSFVGNNAVIVAGSTWPDDEKLFTGYLKNKEAKLILAPHEVTEAHLSHIESLFPQAIRYSSLEKNPAQASEVLIIDNIGMLSRLYRYATLTYIGGGFNKSGIHNTLEAAVYGRPVFFGPNYKKFREARELVAAGSAFSVSTSEELQTGMHKLLLQPLLLQQCGTAAKAYVENNTGATQKILDYIQENRLLTS